MASDPLVRELSELIARPGRFEVEYPEWQARCRARLARLPEDEARAVVRALQALIRENRALFERESEGILDELVGPGRRTARSAAKARRYKDIGDLS